MKKLIPLLLAFVMVFSLAACGGETSTNPNAPQGGQVSTDDQNEQSGASQSLIENSEATIPENSVTEQTRGSSYEEDTKILVVYFSATNTTKKIAEHAAKVMGADIYEITPAQPYTSADLNYNDKNSRSTKEMNDSSCRPAISGGVDNMKDYDIVFIGYPIWWASIPMPIATLLEEYDFSGKTIIPFCSHGGGRFGQSLTAIIKLAPDATMGEALSVHYSGGSSLNGDITEWLKANGIIR